VDVYLTQSRDELTAVHILFQEDTPLEEIVKSPLMLGVTTLAYKGRSVQELRGYSSIEDRRTHLFDMYTDRMFRRVARTKQTMYTRNETLKWLTWLAQKMSEHAQSVFLIEGMQPSWLSTHRQRRVYRVGSGLSVGLAIGLFDALSTKPIEARTKPNQGIWQSANNALLVGLSVWLIAELETGLGTGVVFGLISGLVFGAFAFIQHFALRIVFYLNGYIPWNYARFLDYATERIFLQKVGGGYIFIHRLLMEHFAELDQGSPQTSDVSDLQAHTQ
jgi:hypothetical protein